jgi:IPT/TIG domain
MKLLGAVGLAWALFVPVSASATTVTVGPPVLATTGNVDNCPTPPCPTFWQNSLPDASIPLVAPADGMITAWRVTGGGNLRLRVIHPVGGGQFSAAGTSAIAGAVNGTPNATSLPIRAGDSIGVGLVDTTSHAGFSIGGGSAATWRYSPGPFPDGGPPETPVDRQNDTRLVNADVVLAPVISSVFPASGAPAGGNRVTIAGSYFDGATGVTFGSNAASSFTVDSANQITAVVPASPVGPVDVRVVGPGGTSAISAADKYTFAALPVRPVLTRVRQSASRWRKGSRLPRISRKKKPPVGTTFSFALNEAATVRMSFTQRVGGRKIKRKCVAPTRANRKKPKCTRTITVGTLNFQGHAGTNTVRFQGRLSRVKSLKPGRYTLTLTASGSAGLQSTPRSVSFTIVTG